MPKSSSGFDKGGNGIGRLPDLDGTEKQVKWAKEIRDGFIRRLDAVKHDFDSEDNRKVESARANIEPLVNAANKPLSNNDDKPYFGQATYTDDLSKSITREAEKKYRDPYRVQKEGGRTKKFINEESKERWNKEKKKAKKNTIMSL